MLIFKNSLLLPIWYLQFCEWMWSVPLLDLSFVFWARPCVSARSNKLHISNRIPREIPSNPPVQSYPIISLPRKLLNPLDHVGTGLANFLTTWGQDLPLPDHVGTGLSTSWTRGDRTRHFLTSWGQDSQLMDHVGTGLATSWPRGDRTRHFLTSWGQDSPIVDHVGTWLATSWPRGDRTRHFLTTWEQDSPLLYHVRTGLATFWPRGYMNCHLLAMNRPFPEQVRTWLATS
jgi:hypothetical protein